DFFARVVQSTGPWAIDRDRWAHIILRAEYGRIRGAKKNDSCGRDLLASGKNVSHAATELPGISRICGIVKVDVRARDVDQFDKFRIAVGRMVHHFTEYHRPN